MGIADLTQAGLAREMWARYRDIYSPMLQNMSQELLSGERLRESLAQVPEQTERSFDLQQANQQMQMQRMGVDASQSESSKRQTDIAKATSQAGAENELRTFYGDMKKQAILGAGSSMNKQLTGG